MLEGIRNPLYSTVMKEIVTCVLEKTADSDGPAIYRSKEDQEKQLMDVYNKYLECGTVWSEGALAVSTYIDMISVYAADDRSAMHR